ncbi:hypothetical protein YC2023_117315 [Brassica napus]
MEEMKKDIARIENATDTARPPSIDRRQPQSIDSRKSPSLARRHHASIDNRLPASIDTNLPRTHTMNILEIFGASTRDDHRDRLSVDIGEIESIDTQEMVSIDSKARRKPVWSQPT